MGMVFYGFRVMYGIAIIMFGLAVASLWLRWQGRLFTTRWFLRALVVMSPSGVVATLGGWYLAETGRQPWVIYGILRTADAISPVPAGVLLSTLIAFVCIYTLFMAAFLTFTLRMIRRGPQAAPSQAEASGSLKPALKAPLMDRFIHPNFGAGGVMAMDLPLLSALFAAFAITLYVMLDGFDLGVGAMLLAQTDERLRDQMVDSIMPTWDGNETWLIMAGVALLAAFPIAYGVLLPAFYLPLIIMLLALGLRGVSFEFRFQAIGARRFWDLAFGLGSIVAALMQGLIVGGLIQGVTVSGERFGGSVFDVFRPFRAARRRYDARRLHRSWCRLAPSESDPDAAEALPNAVFAWRCRCFAALAVATCAVAVFVQPGVRRCLGSVSIHPGR